MSFNPYAPPAAQDPTYGYYDGAAAYDAPLASRGARFVAQLLDGLLLMAAMIPGFIYLWISIDSSRGQLRAGPYSEPTDFVFDSFVGPILVMAIPFLALTIYQWVLISKMGQTLGKKWMDIRIVRHDGSPVDFVSGVILRNWIMGFLGNIPYIGGCIALVDILFIFTEDQQCLHDKIAKTKVISVLPGGGY
ncbi:MAG: RDD family protein [Polyangiaceae bacterium]|nr:RDD family protein [Polyangiaceae bacterium]